MSEYLDVSIDRSPAVMPDFDLVDRDVVDGAAEELGLLEYTGLKAAER